MDWGIGLLKCFIEGYFNVRMCIYLYFFLNLWISIFKCVCILGELLEMLVKIDIGLFCK